MPIIFNPTGPLDIATDPSDLKEQVDGKSAISGAMLRCTNLDLDRNGIASTRRGTDKINASALISSVNQLIEQGGVRYSFAGEQIYRDEISIASSLTNAEWSAVLYNPYNSITQTVYALNGTNRKKIEGSTVYEWGIAAPTAAPTLNKTLDYVFLFDWERDQVITKIKQSGQESGDYVVMFDWEIAQLNGDESFYPDTFTYRCLYDYELIAIAAESWEPEEGKFAVVYTYCRKVDNVLLAESDPSPTGYTQRISGIFITWVASSDPQVTHVRIYRGLVDTDGSFYYESEHTVTTLAAALTSRDDQLGSQVSINHDRPPLGTIIAGPSLGGQLYILKDNLLYYCLPMQPEYWPPNYYIEITAPQFPLIAACFFAGNLFVASAHQIFLISGSSATSYFPQPMSAVTGTQSKKCFVPVKGQGIFHLGTDGIYLYTAGADVCITDEQFRPLFQGENIGSLPGWDITYIANCIILLWENRLWFGYPRSGETYCKDFLVFNLTTNKTVHYQYPFAVRSMAPDYENKRLLAGDEDGYVWQLNHATNTDDEGTSINYDIQSKEFVQFPQYFPRYARWDVNLNNGATATGQVLLEGISKQNHSITASRSTKKRLVATCAGKRLSVRVYGSGPVDIYGVEVE